MNNPAAEKQGGGRPLLQISLLGQFAIRCDKQALKLSASSHRSLLAYLIVHPEQAQSRQKLAFQFWPDSTELQARTNLRKALYKIRQMLPEADLYLRATGPSVQWRSNAPCAVDVWAFGTAVAQAEEAGDAGDRAECLERAVNAYAGELLPGHYEEWVLSERETLRKRYLAILEELLMLAEGGRSFRRAIRLAQKILREDPLHEAAYRRLMRLQALDGNVAGALRTYHDCATRLQRELAIDPSPATQKVYERLLQAPAPSLPLAPGRLPLVARESPWQMLQTAWKRGSAGAPQVALVTGEAGIGKTRLAEELLDWAERQGIVVLSAVCYPSEKRLAFAPLAKWLRSAHMQGIYGLLERKQLEECCRILPELHSRYPDLPEPGPLTESWQRQRLFAALAHTLLQLPQPFLLFLDDLPWCDQDTLDWLTYLLHYEPRARFLLLGNARSEELTPDHPLLAWRQQLTRDSHLAEIGLERLDEHQTKELAGHVLKKPLDSRQLRHLFAETEGLPLFVVEVARAGLATDAAAAPLSALPPRVLAVIEGRLAALSEPAYELAQLAAVVGHAFTFDLLSNAGTQDEETIICGLDELWQRRIVREQNADAYDFSHDKFRQVAYESLGRARRRQLHRHLWQSLETVYAGNLDAVCGEIAAHCELAGKFAEAVTYYQRAAATAQAVYANQDTLDHLQRAINLLPRTSIDPQQHAALFAQKGDVLMTIGRYEEAEPAFEAALQPVTDPLAKSRLHRKIANARQLRRQHEEAFAAWRLAEECLASNIDAWSPAFWQEWLWIQLDKSWVLYWANRLEELDQLLREMQPVMEEQGTMLQTGLFYQRRVWLAMRRERFVLPDEAIADAERSFVLVQQSGTTSQTAFSRFVLAMALANHGWTGQPQESARHMVSVLKVAQEMGDMMLQLRCYMHLSQIYTVNGDLDAANKYLPQALALAEQANVLEYVATGRSLLARRAWLEGDADSARATAEDALQMVKGLPFGWPAKWVVLWPLISIAMEQRQVEKAFSYAQVLLDPGQTRLRDDLTAVLQQAIDAWTDNRPDAAQSGLAHALQLAQTYHYL